MTKIVLATHHFLPRYIGGVELIVQRIARHLQGRGHEVEVVCVEEPDAGERDKVTAVQDRYESITVHRLSARVLPPAIPPDWSFYHPPIGEWFANYLHDTGADLVHVHSCYLLSVSVVHAARQAGVPTVVSLHDYWFLCPRITLSRPDGSLCTPPRDAADCAWCLMTERRRYRWADALTRGLAGRIAGRLLSRAALADVLSRRQAVIRRCLDEADVLTTQSRYVRELAVGLGVSESKVRHVPYGLDLSGWGHRRPARDADGTLHIGYLGQVIPAKGVHLLVQAFVNLRPTGAIPHLTIFGDANRDPAYGRRLRRMVGGRPDITLAGPYDNRQVEQILHGLDVVVVPSLWREIGPLVMMEAFAARTPVVASDLPNMNCEVKDGNNGMLFRPGDADDLARKLQRIVDHPSMLKELRRGIGPVRTVEQEMDDLMDIYRELGATK